MIFKIDDQISFNKRRITIDQDTTIPQDSHKNRKNGVKRILLEGIFWRILAIEGILLVCSLLYRGLTNYEGATDLFWYAMRIVSLISIIILFMMLTLKSFLIKKIITPLESIFLTNQRLQNSDPTARQVVLPPDAPREIKEIVSSRTQMLDTILKISDKIRQSLNLARDVQQNLLPKGNLRIDGLDIAGKSIYCDETGGDYYDFLILDTSKKNRIGVAIGDVSGHGIPSALLMATARSSLRQRLSFPGSTAQIITDVNLQLVHDIEDSGQFMTMFFMAIDTANQKLQWVRAGHDPGIFYDPVTDKFAELKGPGMALGVSEDFQYEMNERTGLTKGQIIVLSTDGVWEAHNSDGELFGKTRLYEIIRRNATKEAQEIIEAVFVAVNQFQNNSKTEDDITLVVVKIDADLEKVDGA